MLPSQEQTSYTEDDIKSLNWQEHIRLRPGMYIGKTGDGSSQDDGIYVLIKEIIDNSIDEYMMGAGNTIDIQLSDQEVSIRDFGRGIPLGKLEDCVSKINTGAKYESNAFKKSVGLNGVGTKAVNALSGYFKITSFRERRFRSASYQKGQLAETNEGKSSEVNGTHVWFKPDATIFGEYQFIPEFLEERIWNYAFLNKGLTLKLNEKSFHSKEGLKDLIHHKYNDPFLYPIIYCESKDIEFAITHGSASGESHHSFVNGQHTVEGGTHLTAYREGILKAAKDFFKKDLDAHDVRNGIIAAISVKIEEPIFESQTKTKLGSTHFANGGGSIRSWVVDFIRDHLTDFFHKNEALTKIIWQKIQNNERERKEIAAVRKQTKEREKKLTLHNKRLRDCRVHLCSNHAKRYESQIYITEGESASGSITKARDVQTQAVFSLKGKPLNTLAKTKKAIYENEEFTLLLHALKIQDGIETLKYNKIIIATDADVDGMHIRMLLLTFFLQFYPELVRLGHIFILETPLFRVRNTKTTVYCYNEVEKNAAVENLGKNPEITRFKGLGEISPHEFKNFIGKRTRLEPVFLPHDVHIHNLLERYMGKNTPDRKTFIVENLRIEVDT